MSILKEVDGYLRLGNDVVDDNQIQPFKGRTIDTAKPIYLYRNLNRKGRVYSIKQDGLVVAHTKSICMRNVEFVVNSKTKNRIIETKERSVHAYVKGYYTTSCNKVTSSGTLPIIIKYDPFIERDFYMEGNDIMDISDAMFIIANEHGLTGSHIQTKIRQ